MALSRGIVPGKFVPLTKNDSTVFPETVGLTVGTAGTANLVDANGNTLTDYPLAAGQHVGSFKQLLTGGTADDIWAAYE